MRKLDWPRGKVLGGSRSINGFPCVRGQKEDYDLWAQAGNRGWGYDDVMPLFKWSELHDSGESEFHGGKSGLNVSLIRAKSPIAEAFIEAAVEMDVPRNDDYNGAEQEGAGYFRQTAKGGFRCSSARAFLNPAKKRSNLSIITRAHAEGLVFDERDPCRVIGVRYKRNGATQDIQLSTGGEVVLAAGGDRFASTSRALRYRMRRGVNACRRSGTA